MMKDLQHGPGDINLNIPRSNDTELRQNLQEFLQGKYFTTPYTIDIFDCSEMSERTFYVLKEAGYKARIVRNEGHSWVGVEAGDGYIMISTTNADESIGIIVDGDEYFKGMILYTIEEFEIYDSARFDERDLQIKDENAIPEDKS